MTVATAAIPTLNTRPVPVADVPVVSLDDFREHLHEQLVQGSAALLALFGIPQGPQSLRLYGLTSIGATVEIHLLATDVGDRYPSLTQHITQAHWFERELAEQWGVVPEDPPWLKPIRFHRSYREGHDAWGRTVGDTILPCVKPDGTDYFKVRGSEVHEVAVGPVHAGDDLGRFGIHLVASPRHADGLIVTGPVTENMKLAIEKNHAATPAPKFVIAVGACAICGGPFVDHAEQNNGCDSLLPVDLYIPGCPPHPLTILDGILRLLGRIENDNRKYVEPTT